MSDPLTTPLHCETILLAEDNEDHVVLIRRAFAQARFLNPVQVVSDGIQAIAYLNGDGKYADRNAYPVPALLLLDLKMPNKDGVRSPRVDSSPASSKRPPQDRRPHHL